MLAENKITLASLYKILFEEEPLTLSDPCMQNLEESFNFLKTCLLYTSQGTDDEWTPVNTSPNATQGSAIESNFAPGNSGGWADISASPWLYHLFKAERTTRCV